MAVHLYIRDVFGQTVQTLWGHKLRTLLTMFGITWGVMSLVLLGAVGEGFRTGQRRRLSNLGQDLIFIYGGRVSVGAAAGQSNRWVQFREEDCGAILEQCPAVRACVPVIERWGLRAESSWNTVAYSALGIVPGYQHMRYMPLLSGRLLNERDIADARRVAVLGDEVVKQLFPRGNPIGQRLRLRQLPFEVVGTLVPIGREGRGGANSVIFIPLSALRRDFPPWGSDRNPSVISYMMVQPVHADRHEEAVQQFRAVLARRHNFSPDDPSAVDEWNTVENFRRINKIFIGMDFFLGGVGMVTLALGAIGVMNIMLVSVSERSQEIGVRKALGATHRDILIQFFLEGLILAMTSGMAGLGLGWWVTRSLRGIAFPEEFAPPTITWDLGLLAFLVLTLVTLVAALIPARRAALLPPAEAVRMEV